MVIFLPQLFLSSFKFSSLCSSTYKSYAVFNLNYLLALSFLNCSSTCASSCIVYKSFFNYFLALCCCF